MYVIVAPGDSYPMYAVRCPLFGWTFTKLPSHATLFKSRDSARLAIKHVFKDGRGLAVAHTPRKA